MQFHELTPASKQYIEDLTVPLAMQDVRTLAAVGEVRELMEASGLESAEATALSMGYKIQEMDSSAYAGMAIIGTKFLGLDKSLEGEERELTAYHELGHHLLDSDSDDKDILETRYGTLGSLMVREYRAEAFSCLIMGMPDLPEYMVQHELEEFRESVLIGHMAKLAVNETQKYMKEVVTEELAGLFPTYSYRLGDKHRYTQYGPTTNYILVPFQLAPNHMPPYSTRLFALSEHGEIVTSTRVLVHNNGELHQTDLERLDLGYDEPQDDHVLFSAHIVLDALHDQVRKDLNYSKNDNEPGYQAQRQAFLDGQDERTQGLLQVVEPAIKQLQKLQPEKFDHEAPALELAIVRY